MKRNEDFGSIMLFSILLVGGLVGTIIIIGLRSDYFYPLGFFSLIAATGGAHGLGLILGADER